MTEPATRTGAPEAAHRCPVLASGYFPPSFLGLLSLGTMVIWRFLIDTLPFWIWLLVPAPEARNLILISVDTLRADRLSCYGYQDNRTPHFDRWASEGFLFEQAFSEYPLTLPAHATMLTGDTPLRHGIRENSGFRLDEEQTTLPEVLLARKYRTAAFIGSYVLASEFGVAQGFETFDQDFATSIDNVGASTDLQRAAPEVTARFLDWLGQNRGMTFFAFVHYYDPHMPRPEGYDHEVSVVDESLGRIDAFLRESGLLEKTDIVLTSDHGESLGDHGEAGHGFFVYDSTLRVPLIIRPAGTGSQRSQRIEHQVSLADLMPTILDRLGVEVPPSVQGRSLIPLLSNGEIREEGVYAECFVPQLHFGWSPLRSYRLGRYKYIEAPRPELYDLAHDRAEARNLYAERLAVAREYRDRLSAFVAKYGKGTGVTAPAQIDPETRRKLMALGYMTSMSPEPKAQAGPPVDPKDRIAVFDRYHWILNELSSRRFYPAMFEDLRRLSRAAPEIHGIAYLEGWGHELAGRTSAAREKYRLAVHEQPDNTMARGRYASLLIKLHELEEAEKQFKEILRRVPADYKSRNNLAGVYRMTGRREQAIQEIREITRIRPDYAAAWLNLGRLETEEGRWSEAEAAFLQVVQREPMNPAGHRGLAEVLRAQGRMEEAARAEEQVDLLGRQLRPQPEASRPQTTRD